MNKSVQYFFIFLFALATFSIFSSTTYACDSCLDNNGQEQDPGDEWCVDGIIWACGSCAPQSDCVPNRPGAVGNQCYVDPSGVSANYNDCDPTCAPGVSDKFTYNTNRTCQCNARAPQRPFLEVPLPNSITPSDLQPSTGGYQVFLNWASPTDWGADCSPADVKNYELFISTVRNNMPDVTSGLTPYRVIPVTGSSEFVFTGTPGLTYYWTVRLDNGVLKGQPAEVRSFTVNNAPTATIPRYCVGSACTNITNYTYNSPVTFNTGTTYTVNAVLNDSTPNMRNMVVVAVQINPATNDFLGPWFELAGTQTCQSGNNCNRQFTWTPTPGQVGEWWIYVNGFDSTNDGQPFGRCTGRPDPVNNPSAANPNPEFPAWSNCGPSSRFRVSVNSTINLTGFIWDATGRSCSSTSLATMQSRYIENADVNGFDKPIRITLNDNPIKEAQYAFATNSYTIPNVANTSNPRLLSVPRFRPTSLNNFRYELKCATPRTSSLAVLSTSPTSATFRTSAHATNYLDLGYTLKSTGWFTSTNGDIYAGFTSGDSNAPSIVVAIPQDAPTAGNITPHLIQGNSTHPNILVANQNLSVSNPSGDPKVSNTNRFVSRINQKNTWPGSYKFIAPSNTITTITNANCNQLFNGYNFRSDRTYRIESSCFSTGMGTPNPRYTVTSNNGGRVAVVYVNGSITINKNISSANANRLLFVVNGSTTIGRTTGAANVQNVNTVPHIQASIMSKSNILFQGSTDPITNPDTTVVIEGPLVTGGNQLNSRILFRRDRGVNNDYPGTMVTYNPTYMYYLTKQERASTVPNYTGLSISKVEWEIE